MTIYIEQYGGLWKLSSKEWQQVIKLALRSADYDYDDLGQRLRHRPNYIKVSEDGSLWITTNAHQLFKPLDWNGRDWLNAAYDAGVLRSRDQKPLIEVENEVFKTVDPTLTLPDQLTLARGIARLWILKSGDGVEHAHEMYFHDVVSRFKLEILNR